MDLQKEICEVVGFVIDQGIKTGELIVMSYFIRARSGLTEEQFINKMYEENPNADREYITDVVMQDSELL